MLLSASIPPSDLAVSQADIQGAVVVRAGLRYTSRTPAGEGAVHCARLPEAPPLYVQLGQKRRQLHLRWVGSGACGWRRKLLGSVGGLSTTTVAKALVSKLARQLIINALY